MIYNPSDFYFGLIWIVPAVFFSLIAIVARKASIKQIWWHLYLAVGIMYGLTAASYISRAFDPPHHPSTLTWVLIIGKLCVSLISVIIMLPLAKIALLQIKARKKH